MLHNHVKYLDSEIFLIWVQFCANKVSGAYQGSICLLKYKRYLQLYKITYYMKKLQNNNNVYNVIHNCCHTPNITKDKKEAVQFIYLSIYTKSRQQNSTSDLW